MTMKTRVQNCLGLLVIANDGTATAARVHETYSRNIARARELADQIAAREILAGEDDALRLDLIKTLECCAQGSEQLLRREKGKQSTRHDNKREQWAGWLDLYRQFEQQHPDWNFTRLCKTVAGKVRVQPETVEKRVRMLRNGGD